MSDLNYRPARPDDLPFIIGIIVIDTVVPLEDDPAEAMAPDYLRALAEIDADPNQEMWVAEQGGERVGCFQLTYTPGLMRRGMWRATVESVHIRPESRNGGLGAQMMRFAAERAKARGCGVVQLTSNKKRVDAHRFYTRLGFEQSHEGFKLYL